jgi:hypothetical protein
VIPILDDAPRAHPPGVVIALIALHVAVLLWMLLLPPLAANAVVAGYARRGRRGSTRTTGCLS